MALGCPMARATSEYVRVEPMGIARNASQTRRWKAVATTSVGKFSCGLEPARWRTISRTHLECCPGPLLISALGYSFRNAVISSESRSPRYTAETPRSVCATRTRPSALSAIEYDMFIPSPPRPYVAGVMPSCASDFSYRRLEEP